NPSRPTARIRAPRSTSAPTRCGKNKRPPRRARTGRRPCGPLRVRPRKSSRPVFYRSVRFWIIAVLALGGLALLYGRIDLDVLRARAQQMNGPLAFILLTLLPLVGF